MLHSSVAFTFSFYLVFSKHCSDNHVLCICALQILSFNLHAPLGYSMPDKKDEVQRWEVTPSKHTGTKWQKENLASSPASEAGFSSLCNAALHFVLGTHYFSMAVLSPLSNETDALISSGFLGLLSLEHPPVEGDVLMLGSPKSRKVNMDTIALFHNMANSGQKKFSGKCLILQKTHYIPLFPDGKISKLDRQNFRYSFN